MVDHSCVNGDFPFHSFLVLNFGCHTWPHITQLATLKLSRLIRRRVGIFFAWPFLAIHGASVERICCPDTLNLWVVPLRDQISDALECVISARNFQVDPLVAGRACHGPGALPASLSSWM
jgi:hypothetical protein